MKVSIFTPTHNPEFLGELYESIKNQPFDEWVIVKSLDVVIPDQILDDQRVKVHEAYGEIFVGKLKKICCSYCTGDIFVELDHDDLLVDGAIDEIKKAFADPEVGFVFSNAANFKDDFQPTDKYSSAYGWQHREFNHKGHILFEHVAFEQTPASVSKIWYCPNHVRAWRREAYVQAGGHREDMRVLDDQDLIARTYLVTKFKHIDKCLYLYRITGHNTWLKYNQEIQDNVLRIYDQYIDQIVARWADLEGLRKIDLGGRFDCPDGFESVDLKDADIVCDLNERWPFEDNSVGVIRAFDVFEHLKDKVHVMQEAHRVLAPGGYLMIQVPSTDGRGAFQDPTHISFWNKNSFWYYTQKNFSKYIDTPVRFQEMRLCNKTLSEFNKQNFIIHTVAHLIALKGKIGEPGLIEI